MENIKGILFDISGVLYIGEEAIKGASQTVALLRKHYAIRFVTNTTRILPSRILKKLQTFGFDIDAKEIFTVLDASRDFVQTKGACILPLMTDEASGYFDAFTSDIPDYVVVGDAYSNFDYAHMNRAFRALMQGADLIAAAKNRYFKEADASLSLDAGGFVAALEYATGKEALIIGKPSSTFFHLAVGSMGLDAKEVLMIGDDIEADIKGAQEAGLQAALVKTGKFMEKDLNQSITPNLILEDVTVLPKYVL